MKFSGLQIHNWRQFENIDLNFDNRVTIITGANGAGKSTLLRILSSHFGWGNIFLGTPKMDRLGILNYITGLFRNHADSPHAAGQSIIGSISYDNGVRGNLSVPIHGSISFNVYIAPQQPTQGLYIPSHRPVVTYQPISNIPTTGLSAQQAYQSYFQEVSSKYNNSYTQLSPTYRMKEAIISMATFGPGNKNVQANPELEKVFYEFEETLRTVLPPDLGFKNISVRIPDVVLVTDTGDFVIDAASGGLMSLIDLTWQIFLYSRGKDEFVVVLDEIENHLHPSMQRTILQNLSNSFPRAQFIVATHSPFVVSSVKNAPVYVLHYNDSHPTAEAPTRSVSSLLLDNFSKAGTASEILRTALGVPVTMPMWAEEELRSIASNYTMADLTEERLNELRSRLDQAGLGDFYPDAIRQMAGRI